MHGDTSASLGESGALEHHLPGRGARKRAVEVLRVAMKAAMHDRETRAVRVDGRVRLVVYHRRVHAALESEHRRHSDAAAFTSTGIHDRGLAQQDSQHAFAYHVGCYGKMVGRYG
jgi:hypothetical protein